MVLITVPHRHLGGPRPTLVGVFLPPHELTGAVERESTTVIQHTRVVTWLIVSLTPCNKLTFFHIEKHESTVTTQRTRWGINQALYDIHQLSNQVDLCILTVGKIEIKIHNTHFT